MAMSPSIAGTALPMAPVPVSAPTAIEVLGSVGAWGQPLKSGHSRPSSLGHLGIAAAGASACAAGRLAARKSRRRGRAAVARCAHTVFIDGEAGTTGLQVKDRLAKHPNIEILSLPENLRKDEKARREALCEADAVVLCLPDDAAKAAVAMLDESGAKTVVVDASTAHRVSEGWTYGFPEMSQDQAAAIAASKRIANPGCYPTGFIGLVRPLVDAGLLPGSTQAVVHAVSGYSGGGKALIELYEGGDHEPWGAYGFALAHKHLAEMAKWTGLAEEPIFCPAVGDFRQGMVVSVPLRLSQLAPGTTPAQVQEALAKHYEGKRFVKVAPLNDMESLERGAFLRPDTLNDTNNLELFSFANESKGTMWLAARLDNLGKGASGACVQNLNLVFGLDEAAGLA
eukprot:CAMPEP_0170598694 /NCGR_PEP_ID=MMETSP0224-20130122/16386_1 /TAXON_ID=285029 /ORGANISM="Togula jolla, Strain CCCM 725" /LENGTH=397 /DNA_ID=CAMNT_0010923267 /DNA_START=56 /DNA_END=1249 /DNA_ORIENTATION=+